MKRVNDFFCGAGGMGLGFKQAGFRLAGAWDFDKYAVESYGQNVSPKVKQADVSQMTGADIPYADVWTFGFPCQDISVAGKRAGMVKGQTRSGLFYEIMRLLDEVEHKPLVIMAENVKAVKNYLPEIEKEYNAQGYRMFTTLYNSKYWGVPQNRERYFIVGIHQSIERDFIFPEQQTDFVPKLSSILEDEVEEKFYISEEKSQKVIEQAMERVDLESIHACVTPARVNRRQQGRRAKGSEESMFTLTSQDLHGVLIGKCIDDQGRLNKEIKLHDISPCLRAEEHGNNKKTIVGNTNKANHGEILAGKTLIPAPVMRDGTCYAVTTRTHAQPVIHGIDRKQGHFVFEHDLFWRVRRLTPREYARLQGFPDSFEFHVSNSQLYKQFGNAVTVNVSKAIAEAIKTFLESGDPS